MKPPKKSNMNLKIHISNICRGKKKCIKCYTYTHYITFYTVLPLHIIGCIYTLYIYASALQHITHTLSTSYKHISYKHIKLIENCYLYINVKGKRRIGLGVWYSVRIRTLVTYTVSMIIHIVYLIKTESYRIHNTLFYNDNAYVHFWIVYENVMYEKPC